MKRLGEKNQRKAAPGSDAPSGRQTMVPVVPETASANVGDAKNLRQRKREAVKCSTDDVRAKMVESGGLKKGEKASPEKWKKVGRRAAELAMNEGQRRPGERHARRAKRELLGLQTLPDPDNPTVPKESQA